MFQWSQTKEDMLICRDTFSDGICGEQMPPERSFMSKLLRKSVHFSQICANQVCACVFDPKTASFVQIPLGLGSHVT